MNNKEIEQLTIKRLLGDNDRYIIPMYQRNYAWEEGEITQLLQDVIDSIPQDKPYYIGTLVVFNRGGHTYETIDGQQRLTTLSLLASYLKNENAVADSCSWYKDVNIQFDSREQSSKTFGVIFGGNFEDSPKDLLKEEETNHALLNGYRLIGEKLTKLIEETASIDLQGFTDYLFNKVQIMRVSVPKDTDLNHYFEIMNNRGEQLEKHEILKAKMLEVLNQITDRSEREQSQYCLNAIWEATANMEKYVQMGFSLDLRNSIFGHNDWGRLEYTNFDDLRLLPAFNKANSESNQSKNAQIKTKKLSDIIKDPIVVAETANDHDDQPDRFSTVINFPNFLLHVLRITHKSSEDDIPLDDKRLIDTFEEHLINHGVEAVKSFAFSLLKSKYLYDQFIIKREFLKGTDSWSLKRLKRSDNNSPYYVNAFSEDSSEENAYSKNRAILMLLSAFHVSTPTMVYKHWLNASMLYLFEAENITADNYLAHLESVARAFVFDRFLSPSEGLDYFSMLYQNEGICQLQRSDFHDEALNEKLSFGVIENNFVFNYLDYLLWLQEWQTNEQVNRKIRTFEFTFRSSVEHYYPQNPMHGHERLESAEDLNSFGNLCLISHSKNSRLSNFMPTAKKEHYQGKDSAIDSIKQYFMMESAGEWGADSIRKHGEVMKETLLASLERSTSLGSH